ncbi:MAG: hypothetical protein AB7Q64_24150 [Verrucomicrobiales bacterium]
MKLMATYAPQYTLHDETHLLRVVDLMGHILGDDADNLDGIELVLLILSAYFHDQGMIPTREGYEEMLDSDDFKLHRENWQIEHPNYKEIQRQRLRSQTARNGNTVTSSQIDEMDQAQLTEYLRAHHGRKSSEFVLAEYGNDQRLQSDGISLAPYLASLCESHTRQCSDICNLPYCSWDEQIGHRSVNMVHLATILRIADILDFDRERTPDVLFRSIHFTSKVSIREWERHRSVIGWSISPKKIRITAECTDPTYHRAINQYMDWIEQEIRDSKHLLRQQPHTLAPKEIGLPDVIERERIRPKNNAYRLHDLEFGLQRDEIVRLLMTDKLYGNPGLCVRELLQNSLDALRYRKALYAEAGMGWEAGKVTLRHYRNAVGEEVLECGDNGIGMDEEIIRNFLTKVGRSYYRSPLFERERSRLQKSGHDFDPCSKFGIGFMSCFMIGDRIVVKTRKDYGSGKEWGPPLVVEVHGLSGTVVVRDGDASQEPGTTIIIVSRTNTEIFDVWDDKIELCSIVEGYALATEFKIDAHCEIESISDTVKVPTSPALFPTALERKGVQGAFLIEQPLEDVHPHLRGYVRESFLTDENGKLVLESREGKWIRNDPHQNSMHWEFQAIENTLAHDNCLRQGIGDIPVCIDGILLTGPPGRNGRSRRSERLGWSNSNIYSNFSALLDARGSVKPEFTPARTAPNRSFAHFPPGWAHVDLLLNKAKGLLLEKLLLKFSETTDPEIIWKLLLIHGESPTTIPMRTLLSRLAFPVVSDDGSVLWRNIQDVGRMRLHDLEKLEFEIQCGGGQIRATDELKAWEADSNESSEAKERVHLLISSTVVEICELDAEDGQLLLTASSDNGTTDCPEDRIVRHSLSGPAWIIPFKGSLSGAISASAPRKTANARHPLVGHYLSSRFSEHPTEIEEFARSFVWLVSEEVHEANESGFLLKPTYWHKRAAYLYFAVPWERYDGAVKAPYFVWTPFGIREINEEILNSWSNADVSGRW